MMSTKSSYILLDKVTYKNETPTIDGYEPIHTLQLNGKGASKQIMKCMSTSPLHRCMKSHSNMIYCINLMVRQFLSIRVGRRYKIERNGEQSEVIKTFLNYSFLSSRK